ncbi:hypothetical protein HPB47_028299 [Ixodes persulcatus]|uniref:Uncharacterized protein n=1 Tax=Ixodes persulcatus TaxID=34615 RepID=A0AC60PTP0_IXOPE|nr:hypothetical protein HPB47_028299 [Ixodes persulcatus]
MSMLNDNGLFYQQPHLVFDWRHQGRPHAHTSVPFYEFRLPAASNRTDAPVSVRIRSPGARTAPCTAREGMHAGMSLSENDISIAAAQHQASSALDESQDCSRSVCSETANLESEDSGDEWRRSGRKRCRPKNSDSFSDVPQQPKKQDNTSLTVIFVPVKEETRITTLNSLKVSEALEKLCQEGIIQVRPSDRLNLIAVDVRNGQAAKTLLNTAMLCVVPVRAYSPLSGPISYGVIQGVDVETTEDEIAQNLRAEDTCCKIANVRRLGRSRVVKIAFTSTKLPSYVLLGHTDRYNVTIVMDFATRKSPANVRRPAAVVGNTMTGRVLNAQRRALSTDTSWDWTRYNRIDAKFRRHTKIFKDGNEDKDAHRSAVLVVVDVLGDSLEPSPARKYRVIPLKSCN